MVQDEIRKGPWTEQEDILLVNFVHLFGDRRWDFIAKVSGLKVAGEQYRTGKSCRLRWVNYLHPGLKRGKMTPQEERLVLELHAKWGNRWSKIARKLPGRTDNEIKNYWRTHMRKKAQERKRSKPSSSSSSNCCSSSSITATTLDTLQSPDSGKTCFYDTGGSDSVALFGKGNSEIEEYETAYSMDDIWKEIDMSEENTIKPVRNVYSEEGSYFYNPSIASPAWDYTLDSMWKMDADESKVFLPTDPFLPTSEFGKASLAG